MAVFEPWPANSPDLNLVENCWTMITRQLVDQSFKTGDELWAAVQAAWAKVPRGDVAKLYDSMVRRLSAVSVAKGGNTGY